jgi:hypothetical protein
LFNAVVAGKGGERGGYAGFIGLLRLTSQDRLARVRAPYFFPAYPHDFAATPALNNAVAR